MRAPRAHLEARQEREWRKYIAWAFEASAYYRELMTARGLDPATARIADFPVLTKETLVERFDDIATFPEVRADRVAAFLARSRDPRERFAGCFRVVHSSGTSGAPCFVVYRDFEWFMGASQFARVVPPGLRRRVAFIGAARGHFAGVSLARTLSSWWTSPAYRVRAYDVNEPVDELVVRLNAYRPSVIVAYARVLPVLAAEREAGRLRVRPRLLVRTGEPLPAAELDAVRGAFDAPVRNAYATSECLFMGFGVPDGEGMALLEDHLVFELHGDRTLVTNLFNRTVPLIRYRLDDVLRPAPELDGSFGPYRIVRDVVGRNEQAPEFVNRDGRRDSIHPIVLAEFYAPGLRGFQIRLVDDASFRFDYRLAPGLDDDARAAAREDLAARLRALLGGKRMDNVRFELREVEGFASDPATGKFRLILPR